VSRGWWTLGKFGGAPIRLHWSLPLGALVWSGFSFAPAFWLAFALLILVHELGHALIVLRYGLGLSEIAVHGAGGYCQHRHSGTRFEEAAVAWGGVLAQLTLFIGVQIAVAVLGPPSSVHTLEAYHVFTYSNLWLIFLNLIPVEPLDGAKAWPLVGMLLSRFGRQGRPNAVFERRRSVEDELRDLERMDVPGTPAPPRNETPSEKTDRIVRELIARTTQPKDR